MTDLTDTNDKRRDIALATERAAAREAFNRIRSRDWTAFWSGWRARAALSAERQA